jgi:hypothetical protein
MGHLLSSEYLLKLVLAIFEVTGLIVFLVWVIVRACREIRDIFIDRGGSP